MPVSGSVCCRTLSSRANPVTLLGSLGSFNRTIHKELDESIHPMRSTKPELNSWPWCFEGILNVPTWLPWTGVTISMISADTLPSERVNRFCFAMLDLRKEGHSCVLQKATAYPPLWLRN